MLNASIRRKALLVLLAAVLAFPWRAAAGPVWGNPQPGRVFANLDLLDRLWGFVLAAWTKEGCIIDPNGKEGCHIDPDGLAGCNIDPDGRCTSQNPPQQTKEGCGIDPNGRPLCTP